MELLGGRPRVADAFVEFICYCARTSGRGAWQSIVTVLGLVGGAPGKEEDTARRRFIGGGGFLQRTF